MLTSSKSSEHNQNIMHAHLSNCLSLELLLEKQLLVLQAIANFCAYGPMICLLMTYIYLNLECIYGAIMAYIPKSWSASKVNMWNCSGRSFYYAAWHSGMFTYIYSLYVGLKSLVFLYLCLHPGFTYGIHIFYHIFTCIQGLCVGLW